MNKKEKRPAYLLDDKLIKIAEIVGDSIRKREAEDKEGRVEIEINSE